MLSAIHHPPAPASAWLRVAGVVVLWRLIDSIAGPPLASRLVDLSPAFQIASLGLLDACLLVAATLLGWRVTGTRPLRLPFEPRALATPCIIGVATAFANLAVNTLSAELRGGGVLKLGGAAASMVDSASTWPSFLVSAAVLVLLAPVVEEAFYRGFAQQALGGRRWAAVTASALLFWNFHAQAVWTPAPLILGLVLGCVYGRAGRLSDSIACHAANNAVAVGLALILRFY